jgi:hypothetical protein
MPMAGFPRDTSERLEHGRAQTGSTIDYLSPWLEELDRIAVGILDLNLSPAGTSFHLIAKVHTRVRERLDLGGQIRYAQDNSIPSAWLLRFATGHRTRSRGSWPAQQQRETFERHTGKRGQLLTLQSEAEMACIEGGRPRDVRHLITDTVHAESAIWHFTIFVIAHCEQSFLQHCDIEFSKATRVSNDIKPRDLVIC